MTSSTSFNPDIRGTQTYAGSKEKSEAKSEVYRQVLNTQLESILNHCIRIGRAGSEAKDVEDTVSSSGLKETSKADIKLQREKDLIANGPIFLAILIVLFTGENSTYHVLARNMEKLNTLMKKIGEFTDDLQELQDKIKEFMEDGSDTKALAEEILAKQKDLQELIDKDGSVLGDHLLKSLKKFADSGGGSLDELVSKATDGKCQNWEEAAKNPEMLDKVKKYMTGADGGPVGEGMTTVITNMSSLLTALNTQNQGELERLNMITKKVDSASKLFSSAITMFKGLTQTLTNYSGS